jgi:hypothetical protein
VLRQETTEQVIRLNYEAAKRSYAIRAFFPASSYLECAVRLIKISDWMDNYEITLELHIALAQMYLASGQLHKVPGIVKRVKLRAKDIDDKLPIEIIELYWCKMVGQLDENVTKSVILLNRLDFRLKQNYYKFQSERKKKRIKQAFDSMSNEEIKRKCNLVSNVTEDATILLISQQLVHTLMYAPGHKERPEREYPNLANVASCKMIEVLLNDRSNPDSNVVSLALAASMFSNENSPESFFTRMYRSITCSHEKSDMDLSIRLMELALSLPSDDTNPQVVAAIGLIRHWRAPLTHCTEMDLKGYDIGMKR